VDTVRSTRVWSWVALSVGLIYFFLPLIGTIEFSLRKRRGEYSLDAYRWVFEDPRFRETFTYCVVMALCTVVVGVLSGVPTASWVRL
jgi:putative spermidine/putrescine transport system permease protein